MKQRFYFDTSVFGGIFDNEFEETSLQLFERVKLGNVTCIYSDLTESELLNAPETVRKYFSELPASSMEYQKVEKEAFELASMYINEGVVGKTSFDDCIHIATATIHKADILVSWNFKHIVHFDKIRLFNAVNIEFGYKPLQIFSPREVTTYGREED